METSCRCASPSDWPSVSSHDLGPNQEAGLNFIKRKMALGNEHKKVAKATQFNDARIYKLERVGHFGWKRGKIFWRAAGSFCRSRISMVLNITRDILFWKVKVNLVDYASISSNIICRQYFLLRPWVLVRPRFEPVTSRSAERGSPNWATQAEPQPEGLKSVTYCLRIL